MPMAGLALADEAPKFKLVNLTRNGKMFLICDAVTETSLTSTLRVSNSVKLLGAMTNSRMVQLHLQ